MKNKYVIRLTTSGLLCAAIMLLSAFVKVPIAVAGGGYIHLGDAAIFLAAGVLPWSVAVAVAGIASAAADLLAGYPTFAAGTLVIKALMALVAALFVRRPPLLRAVGFSLAGVVMLAGYFLYEAFIMGYGVPGALAAVPWNIVQAVAGVVMAFPLLAVAERMPVMRDLREWSGGEG